MSRLAIAAIMILACIAGVNTQHTTERHYHAHSAHTQTTPHSHLSPLFPFLFSFSQPVLSLHVSDFDSTVDALGEFTSLLELTEANEADTNQILNAEEAEDAALLEVADNPVRNKKRRRGRTRREAPPTRCIASRRSHPLFFVLTDFLSSHLTHPTHQTVLHSRLPTDHVRLCCCRWLHPPCF